MSHLRLPRPPWGYVHGSLHLLLGQANSLKQSCWVLKSFCEAMGDVCWRTKGWLEKLLARGRGAAPRQGASRGSLRPRLHGRGEGTRAEGSFHFCGRCCGRQRGLLQVALGTGPRWPWEQAECVPGLRSPPRAPSPPLSCLSPARSESPRLSVLSCWQAAPPRALPFLKLFFVSL